MSQESRRPAPQSALRHAEAPLVLAANAGFSDPQFRETVREMHRQEYPLVRMVTDLGLDDEPTDDIRAVLEGLSPEVVAGIRAATVARDARPGGAGAAVGVRRPGRRAARPARRCGWRSARSAARTRSRSREPDRGERAGPPDRPHHGCGRAGSFEQLARSSRARAPSPGDRARRADLEGVGDRTDVFPDPGSVPPGYWPLVVVRNLDTGSGLHRDGGGRRADW